MIDELDLLHYRRAVGELYTDLRRRGIDADGWAWWTARRDELFADHPASPYVAGGLPFDGLRYHPYDPTWHLGEVAVDPAEPYVLTIGHSAAGGTPARRVGTVQLERGDLVATLSVFWLDVYGGGVFVPLRDGSNGSSTYGGGRYLVDTVKGADPGGRPGTLLLDLNLAFHPSCAHDPRWSCPLAPADEALPVAVTAGERLP